MSLLMSVTAPFLASALPPMMFGVMGFIVGPILAALFVTAWEMFATTFRSSIAEPPGNR